MTRRVIETVAIGMGDGGNIWLKRGAEFPDDHPWVLAHPDRFAEVESAVEAEPKRRGRTNG